MSSLADHPDESLCPWCNKPTDPWHPSGPCKECRRSAKGPFFYPEARHRRRKLLVYYDILNEEPRFQSEFRALAVSVARRSDVDSETGPRGGDGGPWYLARHPQVRDFARQWRLPIDDRDDTADGRFHIDYSLGLTADPPRLKVPGIDGVPWVETRWITLPALPTFLYDPTEGDGASWVREYAKHLAREVERQIVGQAKRIEDTCRAFGWTETPPQHAKDNELPRFARRLYLRAVQELPWSTIALEEGEATGKWLDKETVRGTIESWADELKIPLPIIPGGRPAKKPVVLE